MALQNQTKYRIVGSVMIISLLIIIVPLFFEPPSNVPAPLRGEDIPANPHQDLVKSVEFNPQDFSTPPAATPLAEPVVQEEVNVESTVKHEVEAVAMATEPAAGKETRAPLTWWVQLGVFAQEANATALRDKLRAKNYATQVDSTANQDGERWRVRVGPELSRERAVTLRTKLAQETALHGVLVKQQ